MVISPALRSRETVLGKTFYSWNIRVVGGVAIPFDGMRWAGELMTGVFRCLFPLDVDLKSRLIGIFRGCWRFSNQGQHDQQIRGGNLDSNPTSYVSGAPKCFVKNGRVFLFDHA